MGEISFAPVSAALTKPKTAEKPKLEKKPSLKRLTDSQKISTSKAAEKGHHLSRSASLKSHQQLLKLIVDGKMKYPRNLIDYYQCGKGFFCNGR